MEILSIPRSADLDNDLTGNHTPIHSKQAGNGHVKSKAQNPAGRDKPPARKPIYYPTGDGKPMAEDKLHMDQMHYTIPALQYRYRDRPDVYVNGNDFLYYEEGKPKARVSPDCYVAFGVEPKDRRSYKVWEEKGIAPAVVFEFTSKKTKKEDTTLKMPLYEQVLRVQEYFQFDPSGDYLKPRLQGQRLQNGVYQPIELRDNRMVSEQLGLELVIEGETMRFYNPANGERLLTYEEAETQRLAQAQRAEAEAQRAEAADLRAEVERRRAEAEAQRADTAEAELARMRSEIEALLRQREER